MSKDSNKNSQFSKSKDIFNDGDKMGILSPLTGNSLLMNNKTSDPLLNQKENNEKKDVSYFSIDLSKGFEKSITESQSVNLTKEAKSMKDKINKVKKGGLKIKKKTDVSSSKQIFKGSFDDN